MLHSIKRGDGESFQTLGSSFAPENVKQATTVKIVGKSPQAT